MVQLLNKDCVINQTALCIYVVHNVSFGVPSLCMLVSFFMEHPDAQVQFSDHFCYYMISDFYRMVDNIQELTGLALIWLARIGEIHRQLVAGAKSETLYSTLCYEQPGTSRGLYRDSTDTKLLVDSDNVV